MEVSKGCAIFETAQLFQALNEISFQVQVNQLGAVIQRVDVGNAVLREVNDAQPRQSLKGSDIFDSVFTEIEHHQVAAIRQCIDVS